jgi:hypothetical protein
VRGGAAGRREGSSPDISASWPQLLDVGWREGTVDDGGSDEERKNV